MLDQALGACIHQAPTFRNTSAPRTMDRARATKIAKIATIAVGVWVCVLAGWHLGNNMFGWGFLSLLAFTAFAAPRMSLALPRSRFAVSFSDASVFLTFLLFGGTAAVIMAAIESLATCLYLKRNRFPFGPLMIPTNVAINAITMSLGYLTSLWVVPASQLPGQSSTPYVASTLGILAAIQFAVPSAYAAFFAKLKDGTSIFTTLKRDCFASSMTQVVGAGVAGLIYKLLMYGDILTGVIAIGAIAIFYVSYKESIHEINTAIESEEQAHLQRAAIEQKRREDAELHSHELEIMLARQEAVNVALRKSERNFQHAALHDHLTRLPNRKQLGEKLYGLIQDHHTDPSKAFHVLFVDICGFKNINDSLGHTVGDKVLMIAARRLKRMVSSGDMVARVGGDEFVVILQGLRSPDKAHKIAQRIHDGIGQPFSLSGNSVSLAVNIGIAACDADHQTAEDLLRDADIAMHFAKEHDLGVALFTKDLRERFLERVRTENALRTALDNNELSMSYQPIVNLMDGTLLGFEALLRWNSPVFGSVSPAKFIPIAEDAGLIIPITTWILQETCLRLAQWQRISPNYADLFVSVNISARHLLRGSLVADVEHALTVAKLDPTSLKIEITESVAMKDAKHTAKVLNRLKRLGVKLSLDDFGTGYSSLSVLHELPFDTLKIDRSFVTAAAQNHGDPGILPIIISLARTLKMGVIAEGIETVEQLTLLRSLGCNYGQGYLFARPLNLEAAEKALYGSKNWIPTDNSGRRTENRVNDPEIGQPALRV